MSRKKQVVAGGRTVWAHDNSHDIVMAHLVEVGISEGLAEEVVSPWRNAATLRNLGFAHDEADVPTTALFAMLDTVRTVVEAGGDLAPDDLAGWSVLGGRDVSDGVIRGGMLPANAIIDVVDGLQEMIVGSLDPDPPNARWYLGDRNGRTTVPA